MPNATLVVVCGVGGSGGNANFYKLTKAYGHEFGDDGQHFTAANMCYGSFGGVYGKDFICVQSMDGMLSFFEQDRFAFTRQLECLLPGPMVYLPKTDSIITCSSKMCVESYKYHVLAAATRDVRRTNLLVLHSYYLRCLEHY